MKFLLILIILFIMSVYSNTILYGGQSCSTEIETKFGNSKTKFNILQNKIKEIKNVYNNLKKNLHNKLKQFHLISNQNNLNNTLDGYKTDLKNEVLNFNSINLNLYGGQLSSVCKLKKKMTSAYNVLEKSLSIFLKTHITKYKKQSLIDIENWYNDIKNNLLTSNFEKTDDYDSKIINLSYKYEYFHKVDIKDLNNLNQINNSFLYTKGTSDIIKFQLVKLNITSNDSNPTYLSIKNNDAFLINCELHDINSNKPYLQTDLSLYNYKEIYITCKKNDTYKITFINNIQNKIYIDINKIYKRISFIYQENLRNILTTISAKSIMFDYYINPLKEDLIFIKYEYKSILIMISLGLIYTDFISKSNSNLNIYDKSFYAAHPDIGPYLSRTNRYHDHIHTVSTLTFKDADYKPSFTHDYNNNFYDYDKYYNYYNHSTKSDNTNINYYLTELFKTSTDNNSNLLRDYLRIASEYYGSICTDDINKKLNFESFLGNYSEDIENNEYFEYTDINFNNLKQNMTKINLLINAIQVIKKIKNRFITDGIYNKPANWYYRFVWPPLVTTTRLIENFIIYTNAAYQYHFISIYSIKVFYNIYNNFNKFKMRNIDIEDKMKIENILYNDNFSTGIKLNNYGAKFVLKAKSSDLTWSQFFVYRYFEAFDSTLKITVQTESLFKNMNSGDSFGIKFHNYTEGFIYPSNLNDGPIPSRINYKYTNDDNSINSINASTYFGTSQSFRTYYTPLYKVYRSIARGTNMKRALAREIRLYYKTSDVPHFIHDQAYYLYNYSDKKNTTNYVPMDWFKKYGNKKNTFEKIHFTKFDPTDESNLKRMYGLRDRRNLLESIKGKNSIVYEKINTNTDLKLFKDRDLQLSQNVTIKLNQNEFILAIDKNSLLNIYNFYFMDLPLAFFDRSKNDNKIHIYYITNIYSGSSNYKGFIKIKYLNTLAFGAIIPVLDTIFFEDSVNSNHNYWKNTTNPLNYRNLILYYFDYKTLTDVTKYKEITDISHFIILPVNNYLGAFEQKKIWRYVWNTNQRRYIRRYEYASVEKWADYDMYESLKYTTLRNKKHYFYKNYITGRTYTTALNNLRNQLDRRYIYDPVDDYMYIPESGQGTIKYDDFTLKIHNVEYNLRFLYDNNQTNVKLQNNNFVEVPRKTSSHIKTKVIIRKKP